MRVSMQIRRRDRDVHNLEEITAKRNGKGREWEARHLEDLEDITHLELLIAYKKERDESEKKQPPRPLIEPDIPTEEQEKLSNRELDVGIASLDNQIQSMQKALEGNQLDDNNPAEVGVLQLRRLQMLNLLEIRTRGEHDRFRQPEPAPVAASAPAVATWTGVLKRGNKRKNQEDLAEALRIPRASPRRVRFVSPSRSRSPSAEVRKRFRRPEAEREVVDVEAEASAAPADAKELEAEDEQAELQDAGLVASAADTEQAVEASGTDPEALAKYLELEKELAWTMALFYANENAFDRSDKLFDSTLGAFQDVKAFKTWRTKKLAETDIRALEQAGYKVAIGKDTRFPKVRDKITNKAVVGSRFKEEYYLGIIFKAVDSLQSLEEQKGEVNFFEPPSADQPRLFVAISKFNEFCALPWIREIAQELIATFHHHFVEDTKNGGLKVVDEKTFEKIAAERLAEAAQAAAVAPAAAGASPKKKKKIIIEILDEEHEAESREAIPRFYDNEAEMEKSRLAIPAYSPNVERLRPKISALWLPSWQLVHEALRQADGRACYDALNEQWRPEPLVRRQVFTQIYFICLWSTQREPDAMFVQQLRRCDRGLYTGIATLFDPNEGSLPAIEVLDPEGKIVYDDARLREIERFPNKQAITRQEGLLSGWYRYIVQFHVICARAFKQNDLLYLQNYLGWTFFNDQKLTEECRTPQTPQWWLDNCVPLFKPAPSKGAHLDIRGMGLHIMILLALTHERALKRGPEWIAWIKQVFAFLAPQVYWAMRVVCAKRTIKSFKDPVWILGGWMVLNAWRQIQLTTIVVLEEGLLNKLRALYIQNKVKNLTSFTDIQTIGKSDQQLLNDWWTDDFPKWLKAFVSLPAGLNNPKGKEATLKNFAIDQAVEFHRLVTETKQSFALNTRRLDPEEDIKAIDDWKKERHRALALAGELCGQVMACDSKHRRVDAYIPSLDKLWTVPAIAGLVAPDLKTWNKARNAALKNDEEPAPEPARTKWREAAARMKEYTTWRAVQFRLLYQWLLRALTRTPARPEPTPAPVPAPAAAAAPEPVEPEAPAPAPVPVLTDAERARERTL